MNTTARSWKLPKRRDLENRLITFKIKLVGFIHYVQKQYNKITPHLRSQFVKYLRKKLKYTSQFVVFNLSNCSF
jgi:hypothetical protein